LLFDTGGLAQWVIPGTDAGAGDVRAFTSADPDYGVSVLSCGTPTNGIDIQDLYGAVAKAAQKGWGIRVATVACDTGGGAILDQASPGESVVACAVRDPSGSPSFAFASITEEPPFYRLVLGE
jgi:hypothetical protein